MENSVNWKKDFFSFYNIIWWSFTIGLILLARISTFNSFIFWIFIPALFPILVLKEAGIRIKSTGLQLYILVTLWASLSLIYAVDTTNTIEYLQLMIGNIVVWYIVSSCVDKIDSYKSLCYPLLIACLFHFYFQFTITPTVVITVEGMERTAGLFANPNALGFVLWYGCVICVLLMQNQKNIVKLGYILPVLAFVYGIIDTGSRKNVVAVLLFFGAFVFLKFIRKQYGLFLLILTAVYFSYDYLYDYIMADTVLGARLNANRLEGGAETRYGLIQEGWQMFINSPILGVGLGNFKLYSSTHRVAHNDYIEILGGMGLVAFLIYIYIFFYTSKRIYHLLNLNNSIMTKEDRNYVIVFACFFLGYVLLGMARPSFLDPVAILMFALFEGLSKKMYKKYFTTPYSPASLWVK